MSKKRIDYIKSKNPNLSNDAVEALALADPTNEKKYLNWIVRLFNNGAFTSNNEEIDESLLVKTTILIKSFESNKSKIPQELRDINKFKNLLDLSFFLMKFERQNRQDEESFLKNGIRRVFEDENWLVASPLTMQASIKLGKSTTWCTASKEPDNNRFHSYAGRGEIFVVIDKKVKNERSKNKKFQIHLNYYGNGSEFANSKNEHINVCKFFKERLVILNVFNELEIFQKHLFTNPELFALIENPTNEQIKKAITADLSNIDLIDKEKVDSEIVEFYLEKFALNNRNSHSDGKEKYVKEFKKFTKFSIKTLKQALAISPELVEYIQESEYSLTPALQRVALENDVKVIHKIKTPAKSVIPLVLEEMPEFIKKIENPTKKQQFTAIDGDPILLKSIKNPHKDVVVEAIKYDVSLLRYKKYKNILEEKDIIEILEYDSTAIEYVDNPTERMQEIAVKQDCDNIILIKNVAEKIKLLAEELKEKEERRLEERRSMWNTQVKDTSSRRFRKIMSDSGTYYYANEYDDYDKYDKWGFTKREIIELMYNEWEYNKKTE
jgi:hypothetical protein